MNLIMEVDAKIPVSGMRYCPGCHKPVQYVDLENWIYRNTLKVCPNGCESAPGTLKPKPA